MDKDKDVWRFYRQPGDEREMPARPSFAILTAYHQADLFRIVYRAMRLYCGFTGKVTAGAIVDLYEDFQDWKENLPDELQADTGTGNPQPHILYLHIQLNTAVVQLLRPLAQSNLFTDAQSREFQDMIITHAKRGLGHLERASNLYSSRFHTPLLSFCCVHLADAIIVHEPAIGPAVLEFVLKTLNQTKQGFPLCGPLQELLRQRGQTYNIPIPQDIEELLGSPVHSNLDAILDACTRLTYMQPVERILSHFRPDISQDWPKRMSRFHQRSGSSGSDRIQIDALLNDT
ncbi:MAG: hypothetical protein Q9163_004112 [Psora crenata]